MSSPSSESSSPMPTSSAPMSVEHKPDISDFFKSGPVRVVSDPEGYHVAQLANQEKTTEGYKATENKILVLGDLFDYTLGAGSNGDNFATTKLTELRNAKSHSFESVKYCNENNGKIKVLFGNRDLNKLKLLPLALVTNSDDEYIKWWEAESYAEGARQLVNLIAKKPDEDKPGCKWDIPTMEHWKPFWKLNQNNNYNLCNVSEKQNEQTNVIKEGPWNSDNPRLGNTSQMSCLERFYLIFGRDCFEGTMSAQNTLFGVANECGLYAEIFGEFQNELNNKSRYNNNFLFRKTKDDGEPIPDMNISIELNAKAELAAALVFTVFADALYGDKTNANPKKFTGVLREFFLSDNTYYCTYAELDNNLLVFSHGGLRDEFFKCNIDSNLISQVYADKKLGDMVQKQAETHNQEGGYIGTNATVIPAEDIKKRIDLYNSEMKSELKTLIDEYKNLIDSKSKKQDKPTAELLLNLVISAPYASPEGSGSCFHRHASPIMPGLDHPLPGEKPNAYRAKPICAQGKTLYQFVGHFPLGFAPTIDKYTTTGLDGIISYAINLDVSNSLFGQFDKLDISKIHGNYSYVEVNTTNNILKLLSNVNVGVLPQEIEGIDGKPVLKQILINGYDILSLPKSEPQIPNLNQQPYLNYHGQIEYNNIFYHIFTYLTGFTVHIYVTYEQKSVAELATKFKGGKSTHRSRQMKGKRTGKCKSGANKLYVRTTRTLVRRRKPNKKTTSKKI